MARARTAKQKAATRKMIAANKAAREHRSPRGFASRRKPRARPRVGPRLPSGGFMSARALEQIARGEGRRGHKGLAKAARAVKKLSPKTRRAVEAVVKAEGRYGEGAAQYIGRNKKTGKSYDAGGRIIGTRRARKAAFKARRLHAGPKLRVGQSKTQHVKSKKKGTRYTVKITRTK